MWSRGPLEVLERAMRQKDLANKPNKKRPEASILLNTKINVLGQYAKASSIPRWATLYYSWSHDAQKYLQRKMGNMFTPYVIPCLKDRIIICINQYQRFKQHVNIPDSRIGQKSIQTPGEITISRPWVPMPGTEKKVQADNY